MKREEYKKKKPLVRLFFLVAEVGFEPHDLRVMSPTSYQAALLRDIIFLPCGAGDRGRTGTILSYHGILSPGRLPVPPHRRVTVFRSAVYVLYHTYLCLSTPFFNLFAAFFSSFFLVFRPLFAFSPKYRRDTTDSDKRKREIATHNKQIPRKALDRNF